MVELQQCVCNRCPSDGSVKDVEHVACHIRCVHCMTAALESLSLLKEVFWLGKGRLINAYPAY